ncbi:hypothetical protein ACQ4PT_058743 [Festuca glaucescens]
MGLLGLKLLMSMQRGGGGRSTGSRTKRKRPPCQGDTPQGPKKIAYSGPDLPADIWCHIHSLLPMRDAARVACVSQAFLQSWRCHPNLTFNKETLGLNKNASQKDGASTDLTVIIDRILERHSGTRMKAFKLAFCDCVVDTCNLNNWLQTAATLRVEELCLSLPSNHYKKDPYNFPCSILADECGNSMIQKLFVGICAFRPVSGLAKLTTLDLCMVHITGDELGSLVSSSSALERLTIRYCNEITYLKISSLMQHLSYLMMFECRYLQMVDIKAPNLSTFYFSGTQIQLSFGEAVQVKNVTMRCFVQCNTVYYACVKLPSIVPNVETLNIYSSSEGVNIPILPIKFLHLKHLSICLGAGDGSFCPAYDYLSLVYFLHGCPVLETFELNVSHTSIIHNSYYADPSHLKQMPEYLHNNIKKVGIIGFWHSKAWLS